MRWVFAILIVLYSGLALCEWRAEATAIVIEPPRSRAIVKKSIGQAIPAQAIPRPRQRLRIKAQTSASWQATVFISRKDAQKIQRNPLIGQTLERSVVTVITDPLIG